jgi:phage terminase large subunit
MEMVTVKDKLKSIDVVFNPINDQQARFVQSDAERLLFSGAVGAGKTMAGLAKGMKLSIENPGNFGLVCRKTRRSLTHTTMRTFWHMVCPPAAVADYNKTEGLITLVNGSQIIFGGLDDPLKLGSLELGWIFIDETIETAADDWRMLETRLRLPAVPHQIFGATNPGSPNHYLYQMFFMDRLGEVYQAGTMENPLLPEDYKDRVGQLTGSFYERYVLGKWVGFEGLVYQLFDINRHLCEAEGQWQKVIMGCDWGFSNPACLLVIAQDGDNRIRILDEFYEPQVQMERLIQIAKDMVIQYGISEILCDPSEPMFIDQFRRAGLFAKPANNEVLPGIQAVTSYLTERGDGTEGFGIDPKCTNLIREMQGYRWAKGRNGEYMKDQPVKEQDHACDALRYGVMGLVSGRRYAFGWV